MNNMPLSPPFCLPIMYYFSMLRKYPSTALIRASEENHVEIVECLLEAGADIEGTDKVNQGFAKHA